MQLYGLELTKHLLYETSERIIDPVKMARDNVNATFCAVVTMNIYYVDGEFLPSDKAMIPVDDLAILRGIGVFDLLRTYNGKPLFLNEHVSRLIHSAKEINLKIPWSHDEVCRVVLDTLDKNGLEEANARIIVTGGSSSDFMTPAGNPRLLVLVTPLPRLPEWWHSKGVKVITMKARRNIPGAKSIDYLPAAMALRQAKDQGAIEAIYIDSEGNALEGSTSNLFIFIGDTLVTPAEGVLSGITRKVVLNIVKGAFDVALRKMSLSEMLGAQEVFITGTNKGLVPVVQVDDARIGDGKPGRRTRKIMSMLEALTRRPSG